MKRLLVGLLLASIVLVGCNLAGDVTPPPGASMGPISLPSPAASAEAVVLEPPAGGPDISQGQAIYQDRCEACHGPQGLGDGEQATDLPLAPSALADQDIAREASPAEWYEIVTNGRMNRFMPPFTSLNDVQRWDVVGYAMSLSLGDELMAEGSELYQQVCAECHGIEAEGGSAGPALNDPQLYAQSSRAELVELILEGQGAMPGLAEELGQDQTEAIAGFVQSLAFGTSATAPEVESEAEPAVGQATLQGQVLNGSTGEPLAEAVEVTLHAFDGQQQVLEQTLPTEPDGSYQFSGLEQAPGRLFVVSAEYQGVRYSSDVLPFDQQNSSLELPITVYETTQDAAAVEASRVHLLVDQPSPNVLRLVELWLLLNNGERTIVPAQDGGVRILLPEGASNLRFEDSLLAERYNPIEGGFQLDEPLRPGGQGAQIVFSFEIPFEGVLQVEQPMTMPVNVVTVLVSEGSLRVEGQQLIDRGQRDAGGEQFHQYDISSLSAGDELNLTLRGPSFFARIIPRSLNASWAIGAAVFILALAAIAWWYRPWISGARSDHEPGVRPADSLAERRDWLLAAIADLDEDYEEADVEEDAYRRRRQELKNQLIEVMKRQDD